MTAEQRWTLDLADVLAIRLECGKCGSAVVVKPTDWRDAPMECPVCRGLWELPHPTAHGFTPLMHFALGMRQLLEQSQAAIRQGGGEMPYRVRVEIQDPSMSRYGV
jgi:hypothetical protein